MRRILVVEDDSEIRKLLKDYLTGYDYDVTEAKEGNQASELIASECFDVILMDMMRLRRVARHRSKRMISTTGISRVTTTTTSCISLVTLLTAA